ncbi:NAD(P)/FAD-dependent oxidoreductase [Amycolatopsis pithecellobii]|uniref:NAD(P)/FAD-dependent oxidoreductase n=1 Tax=Amycolatopsis pithecellobii TaxID=664692 RepID=UPI0014093EEF|nr:FAD-binding oxidoreductase [Amycolatopsis pithecellobii]
MTDRVDVAVVGGGIAGMAVAYELAADRKVLVLEADSGVGLHATGRSAGTLALGYGPPRIRPATRLGLPLLKEPPFGAPLVTPRPVLWFADRAHAVDAWTRFQEVCASTSDTRIVDRTEVPEIAPLLRAEAVAVAMLDESAMDIDVHGLISGYLKGLRTRGGQVQTGWRLVSAEHHGDWRLAAADGRTVRADVVVNAGGGWAAEIAATLGDGSVPLRIQRRSAFLARSHACPPVPGGAMVASASGAFYVKPEGTGYLCSPIDRTVVPAHDPKPDELAIARAIEDINAATELDLRSVTTAWAGLQCFSPDGLPVVGFSLAVPAMFWLAGLAGFGIQTAPGFGMLAAASIRGETSGGLSPFEPGRFN